MSKAPEVLAIFCSDLHLSHTAPIARSVERDWYATQEGYLNQLKELKEKLCCPLIIAGDIFDTWRVNAELINFTIKHLPVCWAIPGQHDLPWHSLAEIKRSPYWTLAQAGILYDMSGEEEVLIPHFNLKLHSFPWGRPLQPLTNRSADSCLHVAVVHQYIWANQGTCYQGASQESNLTAVKKNLKGYDVAVFGDNHKGWFTVDNPSIFNCGSFMRRKSDEYDYKPRVGLLTSDGKITPHYLDTSGDVFADVNKEAERLAKMLPVSLHLQNFLAELSELGEEGVNFIDTVKQALKHGAYPQEVERIVLQAVEKVK